MKVLMFDFRDSEKDYFKKNKFLGFTFKFFENSLNSKTKLTDDDYINTDVLSVYRSSILSADVLKKFKNLRIIATRSFGFSHIDLDYCKKNNISVLNVGQYGEIAVSEYALGLIIALTRNIRYSLLDIKNNNVNPKKYEGCLLNNLTIGIIGCGKVGKQLGKIADFFGMKVLVSSYKDEPNFEKFCNIVPFDRLLSESDIIFLHMPFTTETYQIIGNDELSRMKKGVYIINTSSVELIDLNALYLHLINGKVKGAGLDTLESDYAEGTVKESGNETMNTRNNYKITKKLLKLPNVIITPHVAYNTSDSIDYVLETTINNIRDAQKGMYTNRVC